VKIVVEVERKSRPAASGGWGDEGGEGESEGEGAISYILGGRAR